MKRFGYSACHNPSYITNKYTGQILKVGCGICAACTIQRRDTLLQLCNAESMSHRFCMFVTLTYNQTHLPLCQPIFNAQRNQIRFYNLCHRFKHLGSQLFITNPVNFNVGILDKTKCNGSLPYTNIRDLQLFLKRLRKRLSKYSDEKIRYYAVSEYGPKTFRPHWHILLYYDSLDTNQYIGRCIEESWGTRRTGERQSDVTDTDRHLFETRQFGYTDYSIASNGATPYVAGYVNSRAMLPRVYSNNALKPQQSHSQYFGDEIYKSKKEELYQADDFRIYESYFVVNEKLVEIPLSMSFKRSVFPRCKDFDRKDNYGLWESYSIYTRAREYTGKTNVVDIANDIVWWLYQDIECTINHPVLDYFRYSLNFPYKLYEVSYHLDKLRLVQTKVLKTPQLLIQRIISELQLSKHFFEYCCNGDFNLITPRIKQIKRFYDYISLRNLYKFYNNQFEYTQTHPNRESDLIYLYYNYKQFIQLHNFEPSCITTFDYRPYLNNGILEIPEFNNTHLYKELVNDSYIKFSDSIKHKEQNDLNKIFL